MISVIVPGYNTQGTLGDCLEALLSQTTTQPYEVIYVDDASTDGSVAVAQRYPEVLLIRLDENRGQAHARNVGMSRARGEIILFTDADCLPAPDWIEAMLRPFADPQIAGAKGVYGTRQTSLVARFAQLEYETRYEIMRRQRYIDFIDTYSAGYRREVLERHGGFDASFRIDEDQELSFRLAEAGHKMVFNPEALVYHQHPATLRRYLRRKAQIGYWKALVLRRHPDKAMRDSHTPQSLKAQLGLAALACLGLLLSPLHRRFLWAGLAALGGFGLTAARFVALAARRDPQLAWVALPILFLRALALGWGLARGVTSLLRAGTTSRP